MVSPIAKLGHYTNSNVALLTFSKINDNQQPGDMLK